MGTWEGEGATEETEIKWSEGKEVKQENWPWGARMQGGVVKTWAEAAERPHGLRTNQRTEAGSGDSRGQFPKAARKQISMQ